MSNVIERTQEKRIEIEKLKETIETLRARVSELNAELSTTHDDLSFTIGTEQYSAKFFEHHAEIGREGLQLAWLYAQGSVSVSQKLSKQDDILAVALTVEHFKKLQALR